MKPEDVCKRLATLQQERTNLESLYELIERYVRPFTGEFFRQNHGEHSVDWRSRQLYDSTAIVACNQLAASIHGSLTPPLIKWLNLVFEDEDLNENQEATEWLEECGEICFQALQASDFHLEMNKVYLDLASWGIAYIIEEETDDEAGDLNFTASPCKSSYFEEGADGQPVGFYRELKWSPAKCVDKFGDDCPAEIRQLYIEKGSTDPQTIIFCIWKRDDVPDIDASKPMAPDQRPWGWMYVYEKGKTIIGNEGGYYERPVFAPKWLESSDSKFGVSPSIRAMPDILTLNQLVEIVLTAAEKVIDPPLKATEAGLLADIDLSAGGLTVVRNMDDLEPLQTGANFDVSQLLKADLVTAIRQAYHADDLQLKESPQMTATETMARMELMQRVLGSTFGYLKSYMLDPLIQRTFNILFRAGKLPEPPAIVVENNAEMAIEYLGTMARAQKRDEVDAVQGFLGDVAAIAEVFPEALDVPDVDTFIRHVASARNLPASLMRGEEEVQQRRDQRQQMAENREQVEQDEIASRAGERVLRAMNGGS